jgi:hypothetical protein
VGGATFQSPLRKLAASEIAARAVASSRERISFLSRRWRARRGEVTAGAKQFARGLDDFLHGSAISIVGDVIAKLPRKQTRVLTGRSPTVFGSSHSPKKHIFLKPTSRRSRRANTDSTFNISRGRTPRYTRAISISRRPSRAI